MEHYKVTQCQQIHLLLIQYLNRKTYLVYLYEPLPKEDGGAGGGGIAVVGFFDFSEDFFVHLLPSFSFNSSAETNKVSPVIKL